MPRFSLTSILILLILSSSCTSKYSILSHNYETNQVLLSGKISDIEIIDKRPNTTIEKIKLPTTSFPGQFDKISPVLTDEHKQLIKSQISSYFSNDDDEVKINCYILSGFQEFSAHAFYEREYVQFETKIELLDAADNVLKYCTSTAFFETKSLDASHDFMDKIYKKAIRTSIYKCFEQLNE